MRQAVRQDVRCGMLWDTERFFNHAPTVFHRFAQSLEAPELSMNRWWREYLWSAMVSWRAGDEC